MRRCGVWFVRALLLTLALVGMPLLGVPSGLSASTPARAARPTPEPQRAQITFDAMTPSLPSRGGRITLSGRVKNTTDQPISNLQVLLWRDQSPITAHDGLTAAIESDATTPFGARVVTEGAYQTVTPEDHPSLAPGAEVPFEVSAEVADLELPSTGGVYLIGAHALGQLGAGGVETLGRNRLFMPLPAAGETPGANPPTAPVVDLVVLSAPPTRSGTGTFLTDSLTDELADGGRLRSLLRAAARPDTSWIIDPALYEAVQQMAAGYVLADGSPPQGQRVAQKWLEDFEKLDRAHGFRATYQLPDATALAHGDHTDLWDHTVAADARVADLDDLPRLDLSGGGRVDARGVALLQQNHPIAILASTAESEHTLLRPVTGEQPIIRFDPDAFTGGPGPFPADTELHRRQRLLADGWINAAAGKTEPTVRVITTGVDARAVVAADAPWDQHRTMRDVLGGQRYEWGGTFAYTATDADRETLNTAPTALADLQADYVAVASLIPGDAAIAERADRSLAGAASSWWRGRPDALGTYTEQLRDDVAPLLSGQGVSLAVSESVTMLARDGGSFPASVQNHLDVPVVVSLRFTSEQPQRLDVPALTNIQVPPQGTTTVTVRPQAAANGPVQVRAQLTTGNGTPLGAQTPILVNATNLGAVGWIIVVASGIVLVLTTALRIRQVRRERARAGEVPALPGSPSPVPPASAETAHDDLEVPDGERHGG